ncbi:glycosyltransferase family 9 protein [Pseudothioglobus sp. nBUS_23]|uniref:glycosyltransferase family 9 protein n=1 Tax=Pseudothioglobus sp. nBUS_23 TaxID=3395318 RepID=UPI003EB79667
MRNFNKFKGWLLLRISNKKNIQFDLKKTSSVLMLRYDRIGDMVITTPVFREFKRAYPDIELNVLASKTNYEIIKNNPYVDKIYLNKTNILLDFFILLKLRRRNFDVCFEFDHSVVRHAIIRLRLINPKKVISVKKNGRYGINGNELKIYDFYTEKLEHSHFREIWLSILQPFNIVPLSNQYEIFYTEKQSLKAKDFISRFPKKFLIGINLEGAVKGKKISFNKFKEICTRLFKINREIIIIVISSPENEQRVKKNLSKMNLDCVIPAYTSKSILDASALISNLDLIITPDTSISHIASTFNIPVITIHENNIESYELFSPLSDWSRTIFSDSNNSLQGFSVDDLIDFAAEVLGDKCFEMKLLNRNNSNNVV